MALLGTFIVLPQPLRTKVLALEHDHLADLVSLIPDQKSTIDVSLGLALLVMLGYMCNLMIFVREIQNLNLLEHPYG